METNQRVHSKNRVELNLKRRLSCLIDSPDENDAIQSKRKSPRGSFASLESRKLQLSTRTVAPIPFPQANQEEEESNSEQTECDSVSSSTENGNERDDNENERGDNESEVSGLYRICKFINGMI